MYLRDMASTMFVSCMKTKYFINPIFSMIHTDTNIFYCQNKGRIIFWFKSPVSRHINNCARPLSTLPWFTHPLLVIAHHSLLIYTNTPLYVTNWQPVKWIVAPPFSTGITQYSFPSLLTCYHGWVLGWGIHWGQREMGCFALFRSLWPWKLC